MKSWKPSHDERNVQISNEFWQVFQQIFYETLTLEPLCSDTLKISDNTPFEGYILRKSFDAVTDVDSLKSKISPTFNNISLGESEIDLIELLTEFRGKRQIAVEGHRGVGKSTYINYVEWAIKSAGIERGSYFIKIDCRGLVAANRGKELGRIYHLQLLKMKKSGFDELHIDKAIERLDGSNEDARISDSLGYLENNLTDEQREKLVVVFDNLDHIAYEDIKSVLSVAKQISVGTDFPCVTCVRPNCMQRISIKGDARARFQYRIKLPPPDIKKWMKTVGNRVVQKFLQKDISSDRTLKIYGSNVTNKSLSKLFYDIRIFLEKRAYDDDIFKLLETLSSGDTRHLVNLFYRLIKHHEFPMKQLFLNKKIHARMHHPYHYLVKGGKLIFTGDKLIPNLLDFDNGGSYRKLVQYRLLSLIGEDVALYSELILASEILGYTKDTVDEVLNKLMSAVLIRGTTAVTISSLDHPDAFYLTQSGRFYLDKFCVNPDYLTNAVMDVKGDHVKFYNRIQKANTDLAYSPKLSDYADSLLEYARELFEEEKSQITHLTSANNTPILFLIAMTIKEYGFFTDRILDGVEQLARRVINSMPESHETLDKELKILRSEVNHFKASRFSELLNKCTKTNAFEEREIKSNLSGVPVTVLLNNGCGSTNIKVCVGNDKSSDLNSNYLVSVTYRGSNDRVYYAARSFSELGGGFSVSSGRVRCCNYPAINVPFETVLEDNSLQIQVIKVLATAFNFVRKSVAIVNTIVLNNSLKIYFSILGSEDSTDVLLGEVLDLDRVLLETKDIVEDINKKSISGNLTNIDLDDAGTLLAMKFLTDEGEAMLSSYLESVEIAIFCVCDEIVNIPWEWLRPRPRRGEKAYSLGEQWQIYRNLASKTPYIEIPLELFASKIDLSKKTRMGSINTKSTLGEYVPLNREDFFGDLKSNDLVHIIGDYSFDEENCVVLLGDCNSIYKLTFVSVNAECYDGTGKLIIASFQDSKYLNPNDCIAKVLSERNETEVWTPIINIDKMITHHLEKRLSELSAAKSTKYPISVIWEEVMNNSLLRRIYTRHVYFSGN